MLDDQRPGTVYWIDHYVVGTDDLDRWADFQVNVLGAQPAPQFGPPGARRRIVFQDLTPSCHHGAFLGDGPLAPSAGLGKGLPRHGLFVRQEDVDSHLRRLDKFKVPHLDPVRTSAEGADGVSIQWEDPDHNQMEFWAPDHMPEGAMNNTTSVGVGRISHGVYECRDLQRTADFFNKYCALDPLVSADVPSDTLVLPLVCGARIVYKQRETIGQRTGGWGKLQAVHAALVVRYEDFFPNYEKMWDGVVDWEYDRQADRFVGAGPDLPARTSRHGSPAGHRWYDLRGRGDDWYDWDTNCFHFMSGAPGATSMIDYAPHLMDHHLEVYLKEHAS